MLRWYLLRTNRQVARQTQVMPLPFPDYCSSTFTQISCSILQPSISSNLSQSELCFIIHNLRGLLTTKMPYTALFCGSSPLTAEDVEADRRYREALARRSSSAPSTPVNFRDNRPTQLSTRDLQQSKREQENSSVPPSPPSSSNSGTSPPISSPEVLAFLDTETSRERALPPRISIVTNMSPCASCREEYAPDQVWNILNGAMTRAPSAFARKDWEDANFEDRWAPYLRSLTRLQLVKERMDTICAQCILDWISEIRRWPRYDVERRVWSWSHARTEEVLSA
jgi:hypothetical protein